LDSDDKHTETEQYKPALVFQVAQVAAFALGIPVDDVLVQRTSSITSANSECTGGSITSEVTCKVRKVLIQTSDAAVLSKLYRASFELL